MYVQILLLNIGASLAIVPRTAEEKESAEMPAEARSDNEAEQSIRNVGFENDFPPLPNYYAAAYKHLPSDESEARSYYGFDYPTLFSNYYSYEYLPVYSPLGYYYPGYSGIFGPIPYPYGVYRTSYETPLTAIDALDLYRSGANGRADPVVVPPADPLKSPLKAPLNRP